MALGRVTALTIYMSNQLSKRIRAGRADGLNAGFIPSIPAPDLQI